MTCAAPERELLPFLAAGTLETPEREAAAAHAARCADCAGELAAGAELVSGLRALHLTSDEVVEAAWAGAHPPHLDECPRCRSEVETVRRTNAELGEGARRQPALRALSGPRFTLPAMAALALLSLTLGWRVNGLGHENRRLAANGAAGEQAARERDDALRQSAQLRSALETASAPQVNAPIANLEPAGGLRGPGGGGVPDVPANAAFVTLVLHLVEDTPARDYDVEVTDVQGRLVWKGEGLVKSELGTLSLGMPMRLLPRGEYRVRLLAADGKKAPVETYAFRVR